MVLQNTFNSYKQLDPAIIKVCFRTGRIKECSYSLQVRLNRDPNTLGPTHMQNIFVNIFLIKSNSKNDQNNSEQTGWNWNYSFNYAQLFHMWASSILEFPIRYQADSCQNLKTS